MQIQLVIFDIAGTTVEDNNSVHKALQTALANVHFNFTIEEINPFMGIPKPIAIQSLLALKNAKPELITDTAFVARIYKDFEEEMLSLYANPENLGPKPNSEEIFAWLRNQGVKVALDTGFSRSITHLIIKNLRWEDKIDASVASDEVANGRPFPDMIYKAMHLTEINDINKVAKVGDTSFDLQEGSAASCRFVIGITTGAFSFNELQLEPHTHLIKDLIELKGILD